MAQRLASTCRSSLRASASSASRVGSGGARAGLGRAGPDGEFRFIARSDRGVDSSDDLVLDSGSERSTC